MSAQVRAHPRAIQPDQKHAVHAEKTAPCPVPKKGQEEDECPYYILVTTYLGYFMLTMFGHIRDFFGKIFLPGNYRHLKVYNVRIFGLLWAHVVRRVMLH
jgi:hypothetical protein